ncbi:MAG: metallophosphoesterase [Bacilli bacterium]
MVKIKYISFEDNARIIVISDIHGMYHILDSLLKKIDYHSGIDYLLLLGDFAQRGKYPLKTLRYIMDLTKNDRVYALLGNHDHGNYKIFKEKYLNNEFNEYLTKPTTVLYDMYEEYKLYNKNAADLDLATLQKELRKYFDKEISFLLDLPLMIESEDHIFVHAGLDKIRDYQKSYYRTVFMKRYFYYQGHLADKVVVCGHMPVTIYAKDEFNDNIIIDLKKKIISIDGGLVIKEGGQLNALIIKKHHDIYTYDCVYETDFSKKELINDSIQNNQGKGVCWPNYEVTLIEKGEYFSKIMINATKEITYIKNEYLINDNQSAYDDCPAKVLGIKKGEMVEIINDSCSGYTLVKYKGKQGWIKKGDLK